MTWADLTADLDAETRAQLCDLAEVRPAAGGAARVVPVMIEDDLEAVSGPPGGGPMRRATVEIHAEDHALKKGDVFVPGRLVDGAFVAGAKAWRVASAATRDAEWQKASLEPVAP